MGKSHDQLVVEFSLLKKDASVENQHWLFLGRRNCSHSIKTCSKSQSLESKLKPSTFSAKCSGFCLAQRLKATFVALYLKRASTCIPLCLSKNRSA